MRAVPGRAIIYPAIILAGSLLFLPFLGKVALFDWDEINFAEIAREMIVTGDYLNVQINYQPFWEKPPLFIWMQVLSMKLFGVNEFAARFPNAIGGIITLLILFEMGRKLYDHRMGILWALVYAGSVLPFFYFKSGIIDPWFNLFIFIGIYFFFKFQNQHRPVFLSGLFIGLAILTKGPVALLIFGIVVLIYLILIKFNIKLRVKHILLFLAGMILTGGSWFMVQIAAGNADVVWDFIVYQVRLFSSKGAGHGGFPGYHIVVLLLGVFPASAFIFGGIKASAQENPMQREWRRICLILLLVVVVLFEIVQTKIIHYSSLAYFPLTFLAALSVYRYLNGEGTGVRTTKIILLILTGIWTMAIIILTMAGLYKEALIHSGWIKDRFAMANLQASVTWTGAEALVALILIAAITFFFWLKKPMAKFITLFAGSMVFIFMTMFVFTGKIEGYTQRAALDFYRQYGQEDCYISTLGFKSYAHLFYGKKQPGQNPLSYDNDWLLRGPVDKPAYFVFKVTKKHEFTGNYPQLTILYEKNGFIFAARYPEPEPPQYD
ncbi:MAG: glycosyltransferase family 39 protein [Bacteroidales bacterium]